MKKYSLAAAAVAVAVVAALTACGNSSSSDQAAPTTTASATGTAAAADHNDADVAFAQQMIPHHAQAIEMSDILLAKPGIDPRVSELATQIKAAHPRSSRCRPG